jgi:hypothetical protein
MKIRAWISIAAVLAVLFFTWLIFAPRPSDGPAGSHPIAAAAPKPSAAAQELSSFDTVPMPQEPAPVEPTSIAPMRPALTTSNFTPEQKGATANPEAIRDIEQVHGMLRDFRTAFGENPVGTNAEIVAALNGGNPRQARLGPPEGQGLNGNGELVDRWGTPYFFHQLDGMHMEIHSAGADRIMGTADDVVMR